MRKLILTTFVALFSISAVASDIRVALINPRNPGDLFWGPFSEFMLEAASDLNIKVETFHAGGNHLEMTRLAEAAMELGYNAIVMSNFKRQAKQVLKHAKKYKTPVLLVTGSFDKSENMGAPREKNPFWIGELLPDDIGAGKTLLDILTRAAGPTTTGDSHRLIALEGNIADSGSYNRKRGLLEQLKNYEDIVLGVSTAANWSPKRAKKKFLSLAKKRFSDIKLVWAASDGMALGVIKGAEEIGKVPGKDIYVGGVDWTKEGLQAVKDGKMVASIGGHVFQGAWAIVMLHDYFNGKDFASESVTYHTEMEALHKGNIEKFTKKLAPANWKSIDFKKFSKVHNPSIQNYDFSLRKILEQL